MVEDWRGDLEKFSLLYFLCFPFSEQNNRNGRLIECT